MSRKISLRSLALVLPFAIALLVSSANTPASASASDEFVALAKSSIEDEYRVLTSGVTAGPLVERVGELGEVRSADQRLAAVLHRRNFNAAHGIVFTKAEVQLLDPLVQVAGTTAQLKVTEKVKLSFVNATHDHNPERDVTIMVIPHTFNFVQVNGTWRLQRDQVKPFPLAPRADPLEIPAQPDSQEVPRGGTRMRSGAAGTKLGVARPHQTGYYDWSAAANYAAQWATTYNPNFRNFEQDGNEGGDCTNFASQVLYAGGWQFTGGAYTDWNSWWYNFPPNINQTRTWTFAPALKWFLQNKGRATFRPYFEDLWIGDILNIDFLANGDVNHSMVVQDKVSSTLSGIYMSYHTNPTYRRPLADIIAEHPLSNNWYYAWAIIGTV